MKKLYASILTVVFVAAAFGCSGKNNVPGNNSGEQILYKNGLYDVKHKSKWPGYEEALVLIKSGKIQNIELRRLDENEREVDYNEWDGTKGGRPNLKQGREELAKAMVDKQSTKVEGISGATESSNGWKEAVEEALAKAR